MVEERAVTDSAGLAGRVSRRIAKENLREMCYKLNDF